MSRLYRRLTLMDSWRVGHGWSLRGLLIAAALVTGLFLAALAPAVLAARVPPTPIPDSLPPGAPAPPSFIGTPGRSQPIVGVKMPPRHPFMARNGRSNIHNDAYMTDAYRQRGPSGINTEKLSTYFLNDCASVTFDRKRRVVSVCVGLDRPTLRLFDRKTLDRLAVLPLPPRPPGGDPFTEFSGGGYFYLDNRDRAVIPTYDHHLYVVATQGTMDNASFAIGPSSRGAPELACRLPWLFLPFSA